METPIQKFQFDGLLAVDDVEARQELEPETLENISHDFVRQKLQAISREMDALCCRAMTEADHFMATNEAAEKGKRQRSGAESEERSQRLKSVGNASFTSSASRCPTRTASLPSLSSNLLTGRSESTV